jgi:tetratricopeptide (TPR) repeat protein
MIHRLASLVLVACCLSVAWAQEDVAQHFYFEGNACLRSGDARGALAKFDSAIALRAHAYFHYQRGIALRGLDRTGEAATAFRAATMLQPRFAAAWLALGAASYTMKHFDSAVVAYQHALAEDTALKPARRGLVLALVQRANGYIAQGDPKLAIMTATNALKHDSSSVPALLVLARAYNAAGRGTDAEAAARRVLALRPGSADAWFEIGIALRNQHRDDDARIALRNASQDPRYATSAGAELRALEPAVTTP